MATSNSLKIDDAIFKALDLKTINRLICQTDKGTLTLQIRKGENKYHLCLDSVPLDKELNDKVMAILFTPNIIVAPINNTTVIKTKTIGRPKGAKSGLRKL